MKKILMIIAIIILLIGLYFGLSSSFAESLLNDTLVEENSELTYYLNVSYDGVDKYGIESSDTTVSEVNSGIVFVEDKVPDGLTFLEFVTSSNGTIGAVSKADSNVACLGKVVDDSDGDNSNISYHGLHYNSDTNTVSFKIENLQAGCYLTIGIKTLTPTADDPDTPEIETRRDFYNFAVVREEDKSDKSDTVHAYIGNENEDLYKVSYEYTGNIPEEAPLLPDITLYAKGAKVQTALEPKLQGYSFSGWSSTDVDINNNLFTMPESDVVLKGNFTKINSYNVKYEIEGIIPDDYITPGTKDYYPNSYVNIDSLSEGDKVGNYIFSGWTTDVELNYINDKFEMPEREVIFKGSFEEIKYNVSYQFYDTVLPPNYESLLPNSVNYKPGEMVTLPNVDEVEGYEFLGWYSASNFEMPNEDVVIYGEWKEKAGTFEPVIEKRIVNDIYYKTSDEIIFKITVFNNENFPIKNVLVMEDDNTSFINGDNYNVLTNHLASIPEIQSNSSVTLYSVYKVKKEDSKNIVSTSIIKGALSDNYYELSDKEYKAEATAKIMSILKICQEVEGISTDNIFQYSINNNSYDTSIILNKDSCMSLYLEPGRYNIKQIIPEEYEIYNITGDINKNNSYLDIVDGNNYNIKFTNVFRKKGFFHSFGRIVNKIKGGE